MTLLSKWLPRPKLERLSSSENTGIEVVINVYDLLPVDYYSWHLFPFARFADITILSQVTSPTRYGSWEALSSIPESPSTAASMPTAATTSQAYPASTGRSPGSRRPVRPFAANYDTDSPRYRRVN